MQGLGLEGGCVDSGCLVVLMMPTGSPHVLGFTLVKQAVGQHSVRQLGGPWSSGTQQPCHFHTLFPVAYPHCLRSLGMVEPNQGLGSLIVSEYPQGWLGTDWGPPSGEYGTPSFQGH